MRFCIAFILLEIDFAWNYAVLWLIRLILLGFRSLASILVCLGILFCEQ